MLLKKSQVLAGFFTYIQNQLKEVGKELEFSISLPDNYAEKEKEAVVDALKIAGVEKYNLVYQSVALFSYFLHHRQDYLQEYLYSNQKSIILLDIGHCSVGIYFVQLSQKDINIVHSKVQMDLGVASLDKIV